VLFLLLQILLNQLLLCDLDEFRSLDSVEVGSTPREELRALLKSLLYFSLKLLSVSLNSGEVLLCDFKSHVHDFIFVLYIKHKRRIDRHLSQGLHNKGDLVPRVLVILVLDLQHEFARFGLFTF